MHNRGPPGRHGWRLRQRQRRQHGQARPTSSTLKMAAARAIWPATYVANSAFCVLSITELATAMDTVQARPAGI
jgi:hypothetical protein